MFKRFIRAVRQKPQAVRDQYAFSIAALFTLGVFLVWVSTMTQGVESLARPGVAEPLPENQESFTDMISGLREGLEELEVEGTSFASSTPPIVTASTSQTANLGSTTTVNTQPRPLEVRIATFTASTTQ